MKLRLLVPNSMFPHSSGMHKRLGGLSMEEARDKIIRSTGS